MALWSGCEETVIETQCTAGPGACIAGLPMLVTLLHLCAVGMAACETDMEAELLVMFVVVPDLASDGPLLRTEPVPFP